MSTRVVEDARAYIVRRDRQRAVWTVTAHYPVDNREAVIGALATRKQAIAIAKMLAGWRSQVIVEK